MSLLDIVIPVWDGFDFLWPCLEAIPEAVGDVPTSVVIYDNGSDKEKADTFYEQIKGVKIIRGKENTGFGDGCNRGVASSSSSLILLLNSDVVMSPGSIEKMVRKLDFPDVGVCGARLLFPDNTPHGNPGHIQHVGLAVTVRAEVIHPFINWSNENKRTWRHEEFTAVTGACLMTRRSLWNKTRGFFPGYGLGTYEEVDYCMAVRALGKKIVVEQQAIGEHYVGASAIEHEQSFPIAANRATFMSRWGQHLIWDEWRLL